MPDILTVRNSTHILGGFPLEIVHVNKIVDGQYGYEFAVKRGTRSRADWELFRSLMDVFPCRLLDAEGATPSASAAAGGASAPTRCG